MIKKSAEVNVAVLDYVAEHISFIKAGMTTEDIDQMVYQETVKEGNPCSS